ncbi:amino acid/polyamine transporter I [Scenedesmus sp. NREL 46B-D3]|nr:amino acid/polyamine transporter I [Scenedesmus sp. NREL 46B-D3]
MGYKQELSRQLSMFHNFATTFSFLSPITGLTGTYAFLYTYGGPVSAIWGWCLVVAFNFVIGLIISEICSAYPTSGGVYYWAHKMGSPRMRNVLSFVCGWFNLLGQLGSSAGVAYTTAWLITDFIKLGTGGAAGAAAGVAISQAGLLGVYAAVLVLIGTINTVTVRALGVVGEVSIWWHVIGCTTFVIMLPAVAPTHQTAEWVFTTFILSLLGCQWAMVGYDAASHLTEETHAAAISGPVSILATISMGFLLGISFLLSVTFSIQDPANVLSPDNAVGGGNPVMGIAWDAFAARFGNGLGSLGLMAVPLLCSMFCGNACVTSTSRTLYAFSRDGAVPLSSWWSKVDPRFEAPVNAVWCVVVLCFILGLPMLHSYVAFAAITSIGVVGLYSSYLICIGLRLLASEEKFQRGPFHLGRWSKLVAGIAFAWACIAVIMFVLPQVYPVTAAVSAAAASSLNYAPVAVGLVLCVSLGWWFADARKWFTGPRKTVEEEEDGQECKDLMTPPRVQQHVETRMYSGS